jgi:hypothetical protein
VGQCLDVLHESGTTTKTAFAHTWRLVHWNRSAAFDPVDHCARFTGHEAIGSGDDTNRNPINTPLAPFVYRHIDCHPHFPVNDHDDLARHNDVRRDRRPVEHQVRRSGEEDTILHAGRFPLGAISDHNRSTGPLQNSP